MHRALPRTLFVVCISLLCACAQRRIGDFSALDHARGGRPREALVALGRENPSSRYRALNEGMLLHAAGEYRQSEQRWSQVDAAALLHPVELAAFNRLRALNVAALRQDPGALAELLARPELTLGPLSSAEAAVVIIVEQGWAPLTTQTSDPSNANAPVTYTVPVASTLGPCVVRLDDLPASEATMLFDHHGAWATASTHRAQHTQDTAGLLTLSQSIQAVRDSQDVWWAAPTRLSAAQLTTTPGSHVLLLPTPAGLRERLIHLAPGERLIVVTRS